MKLQGKFSAMAIEDLIQWIRTAQKTGTLLVDNGQGREVRVLVQGGRIISSSTNSNRETYSNYLLELGLCSFQDLIKAMEEGRQRGILVGSLLVSSNRMTLDTVAATLSEKIIEDLCELFLWNEGTFVFDASPIRLLDSVSIDIEPIGIVFEGVRRRELWKRMRSHIHPDMVFVTLAEHLPDGPMWEDSLVARKVFSLINGRLTLAEIVELLPFSRFKIGFAAGELISNRAIRSGEMTEYGRREAWLKRKLGEARSAQIRGEWQDAVLILDGLAHAYPEHKEVAKTLLRAQEGLRESIYRSIFLLKDVPVIAIGAEAVDHLNLDAAAKAVLSRIDGRESVGDILRETPLDEFAGLQTFKRLLDSKVIDFPRLSKRSSVSDSGVRRAIAAKRPKTDG